MFDKEKYKQIALKILSPIKPTDENTLASEKFLFNARRSEAGRKLPSYYLIYFLFADLLEFKDLGKFEKVAWSFPIDYNGKAFLIEYRKFGVGVFVQNEGLDEISAKEITDKINRTVKSIRPYYDFLAESAVKDSKFNIINNNQNLYQRFEYLLSLYKKEYQMYIKNKDKVKTTVSNSKFGEVISSTHVGYKYLQNANWIAISCIEAFFSWTEHLFIHLAVVAEDLSDGEEVSNLIEAEWKFKFKAAIKDNSKEAKMYYDELLLVRQQIRNFVAHGAFGKSGNAFRFHSATGTVPVLMDHKRQKNRFSLYGHLSFKEEDVIKLIEDFIQYLWNSSLKPSMYYTQTCSLPTILTLASTGLYQSVNSDLESMTKYCEILMRQIDDSMNMDW